MNGMDESQYELLKSQIDRLEARMGAQESARANDLANMPNIVRTIIIDSLKSELPALLQPLVATAISSEIPIIIRRIMAEELTISDARRYRDGIRLVRRIATAMVMALATGLVGIALVWAL